MKRIKLNTVSELTNKQLFWIVVATLLAILPHVARMPIWFVPMVLGVVVYRWYSQIRDIPRTYSALVMFAAVLTMILIIYTQGFGLSREISVTVLICMTVLKLLETYRYRDAYLVVILCFFVIMTRFLYAQHMSLVIYLMLTIFAIIHALRVLQSVNNEKFFNGAEMAHSAKLIGASIPFAIVLFVFFPRIGSPIWGSPDIFGEGKTGISDTMSPGSIAALFADDSPAFRVTFDGQAPSSNQLYWRGPVLWNFDGLTWSRKRHDAGLTTRQINQVGEQISYSVELEPTGQNYLFALDYVNNLDIESYILPDSIVYSPQEINQIRYYRAQSSLLDVFEQRLSSSHRRLLLDLPEGYNPRTKKLVENWLAEDSNANTVIAESLNMFANEAFYYSFTPPMLSGNTVDEFLFSTREGFCEHYASAFVVMMRMAGIPARVVTGYQGGFNNGEYYLIRQSDAHAWAEVYINNKQWVRIDPTSMVSPERVNNGTSAILDQSRGWFDYGWLRTLRENYDVLSYKWNKWVRGFNSQNQQAFFSFMGFGQMDGKKVAMIMTAFMLLSALLIAVWLWFFKRVRLTAHQRILVKYKQLFKEVGAVDMGSQTIDDFSLRVIEHYPLLKTEITVFTENYLKSRYAKPNNGEESAVQALFQSFTQIKRNKKAMLSKIKRQSTKA